MDTSSTYHQKFEKLVHELEKEIRSLQNENQQLKTENKELKSKSSNDDLFADLGDNEKAAMRQHVQSLIDKIDQYLPE